MHGGELGKTKASHDAKRRTDKPNCHDERKRACIRRDTTWLDKDTATNGIADDDRNRQPQPQSTV